MTSFGLADVASITSEWVDPNEMMADEEYYVYTITLESGEVVMLDVAAFTTLEWRNEAFVEAGYTGDVAALLKLTTESGAEEPTEPTENQQLITLYKELIGLLEQLLELLQQQSRS